MRLDVNLDDFQKRLRAVVVAKVEARNRALFVAGEHVLGVANTKVPHEEGHLEDTGAVSQDDNSGRTAISYDTDYAVRQHEDMSLHHDEGREAKWLENTLNRERSRVTAIVGAHLKGELGT